MVRTKRVLSTLRYLLKSIFVELEGKIIKLQTVYVGLLIKLTRLKPLPLAHYRFVQRIYMHMYFILRLRTAFALIIMACATRIVFNKKKTKQKKPHAFFWFLSVLFLYSDDKNTVCDMHMDGPSSMHTLGLVSMALGFVCVFCLCLWFLLFSDLHTCMYTNWMSYVKSTRHEGMVTDIVHTFFIVSAILNNISANILVACFYQDGIFKITYFF